MINVEWITIWFVVLATNASLGLSKGIGDQEN
jgi:hypothetical protein